LFEYLVNDRQRMSLQTGLVPGVAFSPSIGDYRVSGDVYLVEHNVYRSIMTTWAVVRG
jgi:hypothetical protein